jgi:hypothetical protein
MNTRIFTKSDYTRFAMSNAPAKAKPFRETPSGKYRGRGGITSYVVDRETDRPVGTAHRSLADARWWAAKYNRDEGTKRYYGIKLRDFVNEGKHPNPTVQKAIDYMTAWIADGPVISPSDIQAAIADLQASGDEKHGL